MSQPDTQELAQDNGDSYSDDAVMARLLAKGEQQATEQHPEEDEEEAEEVDSPAEEGEEAAEAEEQPIDEDLEFELDGKSVKLKKSQLPEVYRNQMLDADYRRKTAEVAEAKRAAQELTAKIQQERSHYANQLDVSLGLMHKQLIGDQQALVELAQSNPAEWVAENAKFQQRIQLYQQAVDQRQQLSQAERADQERAMAEYAAKEREALHEKLPAWKDPVKAKQESEMIGAMLLDLGYSPEELNSLQDHRALLIARKAALYDQLQAAKAKKAAPEPPKTVVKPGATKPDSDNKRSEYQSALAKAKRSGKDDDLVRALLLKGK